METAPSTSVVDRKEYEVEMILEIMSRVPYVTIRSCGEVIGVWLHHLQLQRLWDPGSDAADGKVFCCLSSKHHAGPQGIPVETASKQIKMGTHNS